jgi:aminoglycoside phosphotransferase
LQGLDIRRILTNAAGPPLHDWASLAAALRDSSAAIAACEFGRRLRARLQKPFAPQQAKSTGGTPKALAEQKRGRTTAFRQAGDIVGRFQATKKPDLRRPG